MTGQGLERGGWGQGQAPAFAAPAEVAVAVVVFDQQRRLVTANRHALRLFQQTAITAPGMDGAELLAAVEPVDAQAKSRPQAAASFIEQIDAHLVPSASSMSTSGTVWLRQGTHGATRRRLRYVLVPMVVEEQRFVSLVLDDLSSQQLESGRLRNLLAELTLIHEHVPIALLLIDQGGQVCNVNGYAGQLVRRSTDAMIGRSFGQALRCAHFLDDQQGCGYGPSCGDCPILQAVQTGFRTGRSGTDVETWIELERQEVKRRVYLQISTVPLSIEGADRVLLCCQDITARRNMEEQLRESEQKFRLIFNFSPDAINLSRLEDGLYVDVNEGFSRLTGYSREEAIGRSSLDLGLWLSGADRRRFVQALGQYRHCEGFQAQFRCRSGQVKTVLISAQVVTLDQADYLIAITRDITEQLRVAMQQQLLEQQLNQARRMESVGRLAGGIAHDFNNLLSVILGYSEMALDEEEKGGEPVRQIQVAALRARDLTQQLLAYGRKQLLDLRVVDLAGLVQELRPAIEAVLDAGVELSIRAAKDPLLVRVDPRQIRRVLLNLTANACDAMVDGGHLSLHISTMVLEPGEQTERFGVDPGVYGAIEVQDTGQGMDAETLSHAFEPFFSTKESKGGHGLGLAMVYGIIRQHEGMVWAESDPGQGTRVTVLLPLAMSDTV